jgi:hypothetical protein
MLDCLGYTSNMELTFTSRPEVVALFYCVWSGLEVPELGNKNLPTMTFHKSVTVQFLPTFL